MYILNNLPVEVREALVASAVGVIDEVMENNPLLFILDSGMNVEAFREEAMAAIRKASCYFDAERGIRFTTMAYAYIANTLIDRFKLDTGLDITTCDVAKIRDKILAETTIVDTVLKVKDYLISEIYHYEYDDWKNIGLIALNRAIDSYKPGCGTFAAYSYRIVTNAIIDAYRKQKRVMDHEDFVDLSTTSVGYYEKRFNNVGMFSELKEFGEKHGNKSVREGIKALLYMASEDVDAKEYAEISGRNYATVRSDIKRAKDAITEEGVLKFELV